MIVRVIACMSVACVYMCVCVYARICVCMCVCTCMCMRICVYACVCVYAYVCVYMCVVFRREKDFEKIKRRVKNKTYDAARYSLFLNLSNLGLGGYTPSRLKNNKN